MKDKVQIIKYCREWVEGTGCRCKKRAILGNHCWLHYPKKEPIITLVIGSFLGLFVTLLFYDPLVHFLSKRTLFYYLDKKAPLIENITPDVTRQSIDKTTKFFKLSFVESDSGLNSLQSYIKISYKDKEGYKSLPGALKITKSELGYTLEKEFKYGEYLFVARLVDRANNRTEFSTPFVIRENDELTAFVSYDTYENASDSDRKIFDHFFENKEDFFQNFKLYIYKLTIGNKDDIAILKDIFLTVDMSDMFFCWEQIGNLHATIANIYGSAPESFDKRVKGRFYIGQCFLNIEEIGPNGFISFLILVGRSKLLPAPKEKIWEGIDIYGRYLSEGFGSSESRKVNLRISKEQFKSLR